jgi:hypothetical protein
MTPAPAAPRADRSIDPPPARSNTVHSPRVGRWEPPLIAPRWPAALLALWCLRHGVHHVFAGLTYLENSTISNDGWSLEVAVQSWPLAAMMIVLAVGIAAERNWARRALQFILGYRLVLHLVPPVWHVFPFAGPPMFRVLLNTPKTTTLLFVVALLMRFRGEARHPWPESLRLLARRVRGWFVSPADARCAPLGAWAADPVLRAGAVRGAATPLDRTLAWADFKAGPWTCVGALGGAGGGPVTVEIRFNSSAGGGPRPLLATDLPANARVDVQFARYRSPWGTRVLRVRIAEPGPSPFAVVPIAETVVDGAPTLEIGPQIRLPVPFPSGICRISEFRDAGRVFGVLLEFPPPARNTPEP